MRAQEYGFVGLSMWACSLTVGCVLSHSPGEAPTFETPPRSETPIARLSPVGSSSSIALRRQPTAIPVPPIPEVIAEVCRDGTLSLYSVRDGESQLKASFPDCDGNEHNTFGVLALGGRYWFGLTMRTPGLHDSRYVESRWAVDLETEEVREDARFPNAECDVDDLTSLRGWGFQDAAVFRCPSSASLMVATWDQYEVVELENPGGVVFLRNSRDERFVLNSSGSDGGLFASEIESSHFERMPVDPWEVVGLFPGGDLLVRRPVESGYVDILRVTPTGQAERLAREPAREVELSPSGTFFCFETYDGGPAVRHVRRVSEPTLDVLTLGGLVAWSPDDQRLAYERFEDGSWQTVIVDVVSLAEITFATTSSVVAWSRDGRVLLMGDGEAFDASIGLSLGNVLPPEIEESHPRSLRFRQGALLRGGW